jgi:hypothetical protein
MQLIGVDYDMRSDTCVNACVRLIAHITSSEHDSEVQAECWGRGWYA